MSSSRLIARRIISTLSPSSTSNDSSATDVKTDDDVDVLGGNPWPVPPYSPPPSPPPPPPPPESARSRRFSYDRPGNDEQRDFNADETIAQDVRQSGLTTFSEGDPRPGGGITRSSAVRYKRGARSRFLGGPRRLLVDNDLVPLRPGSMPPPPIFRISDEARARNREVMERENDLMMLWRDTHEPGRWQYPYGGRMGNFVLDDDDEDDGDDDEDNGETSYHSSAGSTMVESWLSITLAPSRSESEADMTNGDGPRWRVLHRTNRVRYRDGDEEVVDSSYDADVSSLSSSSSSESVWSRSPLSSASSSSSV
ncbi:hypothetical protein LTS17_009281 [Exophiala oligosperma]